MGTTGNKSRTGMTNSPEMRAKISASLQGNKCGIGNKSRLGQTRTCEEIEKGRASWRLLGYSPSEETRRKLAMAHIGVQTCLGKKNALGYRHTEEAKAHMSLIGKGRVVSEEAKQKISRAHRGKIISPETRDKLRKSMSREKRVAIGRRAWVNPEKVATMMANMLKARHRKPNRLEAWFGELLDSYFPGEWKYVGNGDLIIGKKCPDFVNINGQKQLIEIFGDYWHRGEKAEDRVNLFRQYGFHTLVLWESDIEGLADEALVQIVKAFTTGSEIAVGRTDKRRRSYG